MTNKINYVLPDLCDAYPDVIQVVDPIFICFGTCESFGGVITTIKCFEDNSLVADAVKEDGEGKVLIVDGGGSTRCGLLGDNLAKEAVDNGWEGIVVYGCIRDVDIINKLNLGVKAINSNPKKSVKQGVGCRDEPVLFGSVGFNPGEFAYGDNNGLIVSRIALEAKNALSTSLI